MAEIDEAALTAAMRAAWKVIEPDDPAGMDNITFDQMLAQGGEALGLLKASASAAICAYLDATKPPETPTGEAVDLWRMRIRVRGEWTEWSEWRAGHSNSTPPSDTAQYEDRRFYAHPDRAVEALREALEPFAKLLKGNYEKQGDYLPILAGFNRDDLRFEFTLGDLRRACAALRDTGDNDGAGE